MRITVTGSLGNISKPLAQELIQKGHSVTIISSKPGKKKEIEALGANAVIGSIDDVDFLIRTFTGSDEVYTMKSIATLGNIKNKRQVLAYFGEPVYWLDVNENEWPQGSGESDLEEIVIPDIANEGDDAFKKFLLLLANNRQTGNIQKFTGEGRPAQYYHNLENNNHWHDLVRLIQAYIQSGGNEIDKKYFSRLVFKWDGNKNTTRERSTLSNKPYQSGRAIVDSLKRKIQNIQPQLMNKEITDLLLQKKQIILQGPPGTGKTRYAQILAAELTEGNIHIQEEDVKNLIPEGHVLSTSDRYEFEVLGVDTSIRIKIKSSGKTHAVPIKNVVNYANTRSFGDADPNHNTGYAPYEVPIAKYIIHIISQRNIKLVQFHPSYGYEDFVRGISAKPADTAIEYRTQNRLLVLS